MAKLDFSVISTFANSAKENSSEYQTAKAALEAAALKAVYGSPVCSAFFDNVFNEVAKELLISDGCKWNNEEQKWDTKGEAMLSNLQKIAKDENGYYINYVTHDNKKPTLLDTEARTESFKKALKKEYIRVKSGVKSSKARKDLEAKVLETWNAVKALPLDKAVLLQTVANNCKCTTKQVEDIITELAK